MIGGLRRYIVEMVILVKRVQEIKARNRCSKNRSMGISELKWCKHLFCINEYLRFLSNGDLFLTVNRLAGHIKQAFVFTLVYLRN